MDATLRASLRLSKITFGNFVAVAQPRLHLLEMFNVQTRSTAMRRMRMTAMSVAFTLATGMQMTPSAAFAKEPLRILTCPNNGKCEVNCAPLVGPLTQVSLVYILEMAGGHSLIEVHYGGSSQNSILVPSDKGCLFMGLQDASVSQLVNH
jgi:hypothetical protein